MYTNDGLSRPCLALLYHTCLCSRLCLSVIVAFVLLSSLSRAQPDPASQAFQNRSLASNASLSSNALKDYVIYSVVGGSSSKAENKKIRLHLEMMLAIANLQEYGGAYTGVEFWRAQLSDAQYYVLKASIPSIQIYENTQLLYHREPTLSQSHSQNLSESDQYRSKMSDENDVGLRADATTIYDQNAPADLKVVSWAPEVPLGKTKSYAYNPESGENAVIYIIENGIDGRNREFAWPPQTWLYAPGVRRTETDDEANSHGSCVASKATGAKNGVSKITRLVVVKSSLTVADIAWAFQQIVNIAAKQKTKGGVVVLLAATTHVPWRPSKFQDTRFSRLFLRMENLIELGAVVVVPSGDYGLRSWQIDTVPAVFASPSAVPGRPPLPLIVAGAVDNTGTKMHWSQSFQNNMIWAPGFNVACAKRGWNFRPTDSGTAFAAGMVAGLSAYLLGMKNPPFPLGGRATSLHLMEYLQSSASWARRPQTQHRVRVIWNGLDGSLPSLSNASVVPLTTLNLSTY